MQEFKVPQLVWYDPREFTITLPDEWKVNIHNMAGNARLEITGDTVLASLKNPIGTKPLREIATGKKDVVIVFDDLTRATRTAKIFPYVLEELAAAGIPDANIRFICGLGLHGIMNRTDMVKKLGESIVSKFRVYNHNAFGNCVYVGTTHTYNTKVYINEEYIHCDLKIVVGSCVPHGIAGFGGGSKLIMPGIASLETINHHHGSGGAGMNPTNAAERPTRGMGIIEHNLFKKDLDEAAELAGIDFLINTILNLRGESVAIYSGDWKMTYAAALSDARANYRTAKSNNNQIVIANSYAKANESNISLAAAIPLVNQEGGDIVIIANAPEGQVVHYLVGLFGKTSHACQYSQCEIPLYIDNVFVLNEYPYPGSTWFQENPKITYLHSWNEVLQRLICKHAGSPKVAIIPDATNQYFDWYDTLNK